MVIALLLVVPVIMIGCIAGTYHVMRVRFGSKGINQAHSIVMGMYKNRNFESDPDTKNKIQRELNKRVDMYGRGEHLTEADLKGDNIRLFKPIEKEARQIKTAL